MNGSWLDNLRLHGRRVDPEVLRRRPGMRLVSVGPARIRARIDGQGARTIVFAADPPNVIEHYDALFDALTPHARLVCFEPPGQGFSYPWRGFSYTLEEQTTIIARLLRQIGAGPFVLAFSCGAAYAALRLAASAPELVQRLIIIQAPSWPEQQRWAQRVDSRRLVRTPLLGQSLVALGPKRLARGWYEAALSSPEAARRFTDHCTDAFEAGACWCLASGFQANFPRPLRFESVEQRALVLWGMRDRTHGRSDKASTGEYLKRADWAEFPTAGHFPELEEPERFAGLTREWLAT